MQALLGLLNAHPVAKGLLAPDSITEGKKKADVEIKRQFISRAEADTADRESVSPCFPPRPPPTSPASVGGAAPLAGVTAHTVTQDHLGHHLEAPGPGTRDPGEGRT